MSEIYIKLFSNSYKKKHSKKQPDFIAYLSEAEKDLKKVGAMWKRVSKSGFPYYSLILDNQMLETYGDLSLSLKEKGDLTEKKRRTKLPVRKGKGGKK